MESVQIMRDRKSGHSRGLAYVRFKRAYDAAVALETCDRSQAFSFIVLSAFVLCALICKNYFKILRIIIFDI